MQNHEEEQDNFWGIPIGKEITTEAFIKDIWDPSTDEILKPKTFIGLGWSINLYGVAKKLGIF